MTSPRRSAPIPLLVAVATIPAVLLAGTWQYADTNIAAPTTTAAITVPPAPSPELATDLLSFRRQPRPLAEAAAERESASRWTALSDAVRSHVGDTSCVRIVSGDEVVLEVGPDRSVIPASNEKLLVAAVALDVLGPDHVFRTVLESARPVAGVITGNVYLVGGGDPVLSTAGVPDPLRYPAFNTTALEPLADQVVALGVTHIEGDIVGDASRYDDEFRVPEWDQSIVFGEGGPYDALLVDDGLLSPGQYGLDPSRAAARVFYDLLTARGVTISGAAANAIRPPGADFTTLALIESLPLADVLIELLHTSDNSTAEMLLKEVGFSVSGAGTRAAGLDVVRSRLGAWGIGLDGVVLADGSGLSRQNRLTCELLTSVVTDSPVAAQLRDLLPAAGRDGTLEDSLLGTPAEGQMVAKTGTLTGVKALTGAQPGSDRALLEFALVLNAPDADEFAVYEPAWTALAEAIAAYPVVVAPDLAPFLPEPTDLEG